MDIYFNCIFRIPRNKKLQGIVEVQVHKEQTLSRKVGRYISIQIMREQIIHLSQEKEN